MKNELLNKSKRLTCWKACLVFVCTLNAACALAQQDAVKAMEENFKQYATSHWQEKLFVHTDKSLYLAGETMWLKLYNTDAHFNRPLDVSKVAYVELLDAARTPVLQARIALAAGSGDGSFLLPFTLESGNYIFRAYTNWMKNSSPEFYFERTITIVNTSKEAVSGPVPFSQTLQLRLFPEGGHLVYGLRSRVGIEVTNQFGVGVDVTGFILDETNDTVARFKTLHAGIGTTYITPGKQHQYRAVIDGRPAMSAPLPAISAEGYVMHVTENDKERIKITVNTNIGPADSCIYLFVHTRHIVKLVTCQRPVNGAVEFLVDKSLPGEGVSHFTIFNAARKPVCERLYFKRPHVLTLEGKADKQDYTIREKVNLAVSGRNDKGDVQQADMSVAVFREDALQENNDQTIAAWLWLSSDLPGNIENPGYYLLDNNAEAADNLMLTHGWRRFDWKDIASTGKSYFRFLPEYEGPVLQATIADKETGRGIANVPFYFSVPGKRFTINNSISNDSGQALVLLKDSYGKSGLVIQPYNTPVKNIEVSIANVYSTAVSSRTTPLFLLHPQWLSLLNYYNTNMQAQRVFASRYSRLYNPALADSFAVYGRPDKTYWLDKYTRFHTLEEVLREFVTEVRLHKTRGRYHFTVTNLPYKSFFDTDPLVLFDGVPVTDINRLMDFDPLKIQKIDITARKYFQSYEAYNGVVNFTTYDHDLAGFQLDPNSVVVEYDGLQMKREFYSPVYLTSQQQQSHVADMRNVLYWAPKIITNTGSNEPLSFYTSDIPGKYVVVMQGITPDGLCGSGSFSFTVK